MVGVRVVSPQFHSDRVFRLAAEAPFAFSGDEPPSFIALALRTVLLAAGRAAPPALAAGRDSGRVLRLTLRADNDFYSQLPHLEAAATEVTADALRAVPPFQPPPTEAELARGDGTSAPAIRKTGLGSSAALTVALSAAVAALLGALPADAALPGQGGPPAVAAGPVSRAWLMRCGQVSHGLAQGKVGSGFDVSAAVLGTQLYQRVSRDVLAGAMSSVDAALAGGARDGAEAVLRGEAAPNGGAGAGARGGAGQFGPGWDLEVGPAGLPACVDLLLADVSGGSSTPSMVRKVEAWRASGAEAAARWEGVAEATAAAQRALRGLADAQGACGDAGSAAAALAFAATTTADAWAAGPGSGAPLPAEGMALLASLADASASLKAWRASMHAMGEAAGVPIEPESQTALLDATEALPGVIAAAVPGGEPSCASQSPTLAHRLWRSCHPHKSAARCFPSQPAASMRSTRSACARPRHGRRSRDAGWASEAGSSCP